MSYLARPVDNFSMTNNLLQYTTCWSETISIPSQRAMRYGQVRQVWLHPVGVSHAFLPGRTRALCGVERVFDNGASWPMGSEICETCDTLAQIPPS